MTAAGPLSGVTVVDLSRILAGPYCTMLMTELGARVIKVEPPERGDDARHYGPFVNGKSAYFQSVNRGKESIALDLKNDADRAVFEDLLGIADVVVENFRPGTMEKLGYGWDVLHARYPKLIYASASGFGHTGPESKRPAYDMVVQGMGGIMSVTGHEGSPPTRIGTSIGDIGAGLYTTIGVVSALFHRAATGEGRKVDVAMFDCQLALLENAIMRFFVSGKPPGPLGARHPSITPFEVFTTQDGHVIIAAGNDALYRKLCDGLGRPELATDARYLTNDLRNQHVDVLKAQLEETLTKADTAHWMAVLDKVGVPAGPINNVQQAIEFPQAAARNMLVTVTDPEMGSMPVVGNPIKIWGFEDPTTRDPAPVLDGNRDAILKALGRA
ncbi:CoA:oxalate CoA-transferase [Stella humosa]|uniref:CoA:oxalate CoA-transferase n=1 Tax=Stella humosa TaxID=94 RepID=A0A3N1MCG0_9PROT|nr:CaiB/BaiF CoA-transferase family protein [Stella humosa]ROQ01411.1 CoA:oxalate CoA-transferase [Stella humosa]BBK31787.1 formyl-CoA transferase [Stella humosa]